MTKNEKLADRLATRNACISDRDSLVRTVNSRARRTKLVRDAAKDLRIARYRAAQAIKFIHEIRSASDYPNGTIYQTIDARDARIVELNRELALLRNEARIERALAMVAEINRIEKEIAVGNPVAVAEDDIVS